MNNLYNDVYLTKFFLFLISIFFFGCWCKKIYCKLFLKERYFIFPKLSLNNLTNIGMLIALNSALIFTISWLSKGVLGIFFQVYPGIRMFVENTLITIGGILYGPIIGMFIGASTDLLTVIMTSSAINHAYWFLAILNGFFGGLIYIFFRYKNDPRHFKSIFSTMVLIFCAWIMFLVFIYRNFTLGYATLNIFAHQIFFSRNFIMGMISILVVFNMAFLIMALLSNYLIDAKEYKNNQIILFFVKNTKSIQIISIIFISYILLDLMTLPLFDMNMSKLPYAQFLILRFIVMFPNIPLSSFLIMNIYNLIFKLNFLKNSENLLNIGINEEEEKPIKYTKKQYFNKLMH